MKFLIFVRPDPSISRGAEERATFSERMTAWVTEMDGRGVRLYGGPLAPPEEARLVQVRAGLSELAEGAFEKSDAPVTGFDLLECSDANEVVEVCAKHPVAAFGTIEVRALDQ